MTSQLTLGWNNLISPQFAPNILSFNQRFAPRPLAAQSLYFWYRLSAQGHPSGLTVA